MVKCQFTLADPNRPARRQRLSVCRFFSGLLLLGTAITAVAKTDEAPPFSVDTNLYHQQDGQLIKLAEINSDHFTVFVGSEDAGYNHGAVLTAFHGTLYCQWQSSRKDEDGPDTQVVFSTSDDSKNWSTRHLLAPARENAIVTSGGWWTDGETLVAYINVWPENLGPKEGHVEFATSQDGVNWTDFAPLTDISDRPVKGVIEQDIRPTPSGRLLTTVHQQPGLIATPWYTDDSRGTTDWQPASFTNLPFEGNISRELEPSWFVNSDGHIVMTFRDQGGSYKVLASMSDDDGETWAAVNETQLPDSRAKQSAGNLTDGSAFIVNNPTGKKARLPLVLSVSKDGKHFNNAFMLRDASTLPPMKFEGKYKRIGYSYPKSMVWNNALWVSYAVNKEDIVVTRVSEDAIKNAIRR